MSEHPYQPQGIRLKLARANGHLQELHGEIDAFFESPPFRTGVEEAGALLLGNL